MWTSGKRCPGSVVAFVCVCLFGRGDADSFVPSPPFPPGRPSRTFPRCSVRPAIYSLDEEPTKAGICRGRARGGRGGKVKKGMGKFGRRRLVDCGRRFPGSVSACVYKGFGQNFPLFQSSLEIPWSPSLPPRHRHTLSVTPLLPPRPLLSTLVLYPIPAK